MINDIPCPICGRYDIDTELNEPMITSVCPSCGSITMSLQENAHRIIGAFKKHELISYIFYHQSSRKNYYLCEEDYFRKNCLGKDKEGSNITPTVVQSWFPKSFSERIDYILLFFYRRNSNIGSKEQYRPEDLHRIFFVSEPFNVIDGMVDANTVSQIYYYLEYLKHNDYIRASFRNPLFQSDTIDIIIQPNGLARIEELQRTHTDTKEVFIAMDFSKEYSNLREAIRLGIVGNKELGETGFTGLFMDEKDYNAQIIPEMLYQIRNSRFAVVELTTNNHNVYFEAGCALGYGKEVIYVCSNEAIKNVKFDLAQMNLVRYDTLGELSKALTKRILSIK